MRQLAELSADDRRELMERAERACVVYPNTPLPAGCVPPRARVGIESTINGETVVHVDRGIRYAGENEIARNWIEAGTVVFDSADGFWEWIDEVEDRDSYAAPAVDFSAVDPPQSKPRRMPDRHEILERLQERIFGQEPALEATAAAAARHIAQKEPQRPLTIMALGPTGTGKTATAEILAETLSDLTGGDYGVARLDMVEYQESHTTSRLFGSPPGYIGYRDGASFAETLKENPTSVIIVDEAEKAHRNVMTALMTFMDTGRITGGGRASESGVDARGSIIVFTSNLGADEFAGLVDGVADEETIDRLGRDHLRRKGLRPELVGRLHRVTGFGPLDVRARSRIIADMIGRSGHAYGLRVCEIGPEVISALLSATVDERSGARTIGYLVDRTIGDLFADAVRDGSEGEVRLIGEPFRLESLDMSCNHEDEQRHSEGGNADVD